MKESVWNNHKGISNAPNFWKAKRKVIQRVGKSISTVYFTLNMFIVISWLLLRLFPRKSGLNESNLGRNYPA